MVMLSIEDSAVHTCFNQLCTLAFNQFYHRCVIIVMLSTEDSTVLGCFNQFYHRCVIMVMLSTEDSTVLACFNNSTIGL